MAKIKITFKPKQTTKKILKPLQERARYVIVNRFGLEDGERKTLEAIGQEFGITRERVRQIENFALAAIKKADTFSEAREIFDELHTIIQGLGGVVSEESLMEELSVDPVTQNHVHLYLVLGEQFKEQKENDKFKKCWVVDDGTSICVYNALEDMHAEMKEHDLVSEKEIVDKFMTHEHLNNVHDDHKNEMTAKRWLAISKALARNPLGEWGKATSPNVKTRGIKDYAYLVMRKAGSPLHFREVAEAISKTFGKKIHTATCHNELIKDDRFVLVGRGVYALKEWGYTPGVVRDVIEHILREEGKPLSRDEIVDRVLKERYLKKNTILVNLQNPKYFKKDKNGLYYLA